MLTKLGYRLVLAETVFPAFMRAGADLQLRLGWENKGNAPMYFNRPVVVKIGSR